MAVRELNLSGIAADQRNWLNDHTIYTHGFGVVAAYGNQRTVDGKPVFFEGDIPPSGALSIAQPRIYFGEQSPDFSIVGRAVRRGSARAGLPGQQCVGPAEHDVHRQRRREDRLVRAQARLRDQVQGRELPALQRDQQQEPDPLRPRAARAGAEGRALADPGRRPLPRGHRRQDAVDPRRLHDVVQLPLLAADDAQQRDLRLADRHNELRRGAGPAERQLHAQLGQGDGRRLHRPGQALRLGRHRPAAQGVDGCVPGHGAAAVGDLG